MAVVLRTVHLALGRTNASVLDSGRRPLKEKEQWRRLLCALPLWTRVGDSSGWCPSPESGPNRAGVAHVLARRRVSHTWLRWDDSHGGDSSPLFVFSQECVIQGRRNELLNATS